MCVANDPLPTGFCGRGLAVVGDLGHDLSHPEALTLGRHLDRFLAPRKPLTAGAHADGEAYRTAMQARALRPTTNHKRLGHARQMLEDAVRAGHLPANPWRHVRHRAGDPSERRAYVPVATAGQVIDHCPNVWWRLLAALARFGGLRIPSEAFSLTWGARPATSRRPTNSSSRGSKSRPRGWWRSRNTTTRPRSSGGR